MGGKGIRGGGITEGRVRTWGEGRKGSLNNKKTEERSLRPIPRGAKPQRKDKPKSQK